MCVSLQRQAQNDENVYNFHFTTVLAFPAALLSSLSEQPLSAAVLASLSQQPSSAIISLWSGVGCQLGYCHHLAVVRSQGSSIAIILLRSGVVGQLLPSSRCGQGLVVSYEQIN